METFQPSLTKLIHLGKFLLWLLDKYFKQSLTIWTHFQPTGTTKMLLVYFENPLKTFLNIFYAGAVFKGNQTTCLPHVFADQTATRQTTFHLTTFCPKIMKRGRPP